MLVTGQLDVVHDARQLNVVHVGQPTCYVAQVGQFNVVDAAQFNLVHGGQLNVVLMLATGQLDVVHVGH